MDSSPPSQLAILCALPTARLHTASLALNIRNPEADRLDAIALHEARWPLLDRRSADEILGYDENGLPD